MSLKRTIVRRLDNPLGRPLLAALTSARARKLLQDQNVEVVYDGLWLHRIGDYLVPDGPRYDYYDGTIRPWRGEIAKYLDDAEDYWFKDYRPEPGDVVVDIGAGRGEDTLSFSRRVGTNGRVLAVEAQPLSFRLLDKFCLLNRLDNVKRFHVAVMDRAGTVKIDDDDDWRASTVTMGGATGIDVPAVTLDQLFKDEGLTRINFLKMNIEGAETPALKGMRESVGMIESICICCHDFRTDRGEGEYYRTREFASQFLADNGFHFHRRENDPRLFVRDHLYGVRTRA